jgi:hypothetical protein
MDFARRSHRTRYPRTRVERLRVHELHTVGENDRLIRISLPSLIGPYGLVAV